MTIKKLLVVLTFSMSFVSTQVQAKQVPYGAHQKFSAWLQAADFESLIKKTPSRLYPVVIQAGALVGDGVVYRVLFTEKPSKTFQYEMLHGATGREYEQRNRQLVKEDYTLIHHQSMQLMAGKAHQAIWVRSLARPKKDSK